MFWLLEVSPKTTTTAKSTTTTLTTTTTTTATTTTGLCCSDVSYLFVAETELHHALHS